MPKDRPLLWTLTLVALLALLAGGFALYRIQGGSPTTWNGTVLDEPPAMGDIALTAAGGERVALSDLSAKYLLVFFGYTNCPDVCPLTMARLSETYRNVGEPEEVQVVMITVDPATDTPARVQEYAENFHPDFLGLSGTNTEIANAARRFYVGFNDVGDGQVAHSDPVALLGPERRMRVIYTQDNVNRLEGDLRTVLAEQPW